jgi:biotin transport system substrate-specific component
MFQVTCAVVGSFLIAGLAQLSIHLPGTPVPITGQTLGVLLVGASYGPGLGAATVGLYLFWAVIGLPVLAPEEGGGHATGISILTLSLPTAGYLWGFVLAAGLTGWLSKRGWDRSVSTSIGAMLLGSVLIYAVGLPWLHRALSATWEETFTWGLYPFVIGDLLKLFAAAGLLPLAWKLIERFRPGSAEEE